MIITSKKTKEPSMAGKVLKGIAACLIGAMVCITVGCAASPPADHNSAVGESEKHEEQASAKLPEASGEAEYPPEENSEGEWYRTNVASYQWARINISNWKEGESFDVTLLANYSDYGGFVEGTATFIEKDMAVLYDENLENFLRNDEGDHGVYFQFVENSIIVTHDSYVRLWFGGAGIATAAGTYIQGEPKYTNCTDVSEIFTENKLEIIQGLLGDRYEELFENMIELGEITEYKINNGHLWEAYKLPSAAERCHIIIYEDGRIYVEGYTASVRKKEFYTNSEDTEMPDVEQLKR